MPAHGYPHSPAHWTRRAGARRVATRRFRDWSGDPPASEASHPADGRDDCGAHSDADTEAA